MTPFQKRVASAMREYKTSREIADAISANETRVSTAMEKIDHMKAFQPKTLEQQKKSYIKACKQRLAAELNRLTDLYREDHETHAKLYLNRCRLVEKAEKIQARVADAADKEFGGWDVWRHDEKLLRQVSARMDDAACDLLFKIDGIDERMDATMRDFHRDCKIITNRYQALIKTA